MLSAAMVKLRVEQVQLAYAEIEHKAWNGKAYTRASTEMWQEACHIVEEEWREIIRVLAQGGDYYGIEW